MSGSWIPLLVPQEHHVELATMVATRLEQIGFEAPANDSIEIRLTPAQVRGATVTPDISAGDRALEANTPWSVESLRLLIANPTATARRWAMALDVCATGLGDWVSTQDMAERTGLTINEWRDACRKMTQHQRKNYPNESDWPLATISGRHLGHSYDQLYVAITEEQAARWAEAKETAR